MGASAPDTSKPTQQVRMMESGDTKQQILRSSDSVLPPLNLRCEHTKYKWRTTKRKSVGVAPSCTLYNHFLVKGTASAKKKPIYAKMKRNT